MITVITVTFNNYEELVATLESLKALPSEIELFVVNGGRCEKTKELLLKSGIRHISESDKGISDAFNKGIAYATQPYFAFVHSGDLLINAEYFKQALELLKQDGSVDYIYSSIVLKHSTNGDIVFEPNDQPGNMPFAHPGSIMRKSLVQKLGGFDLSLKVAMDYAVICRLIKGKYKGVHLKTSPVVLMDGAGASSSQGVRGIEERIRILKELDLFTFESKRYLYELLLKNYARTALTKVKLIGPYDKLKSFLRNNRQGKMA